MKAKMAKMTAAEKEHEWLKNTKTEIATARAKLPLSHQELETLVHGLRSEIKRLNGLNGDLTENLSRKELGLDRYMKDADDREKALISEVEQAAYETLSREKDIQQLKVGQ